MRTKLTEEKAFENASTSVAAAQMRNNLTELAETVKDPEEKKVSFSEAAGTREAELT